MKSALWLVAIAACGGICFFLGLSQGSKTVSVLSAQNETSESISIIGISLNALSSNDPNRSTDAHKQNLRTGLMQFNVYSGAVRSFYKCSRDQLKTLDSARDYLKGHPELDAETYQAFERNSHSLCSSQGSGV